MKEQKKTLGVDLNDSGRIGQQVEAFIDGKFTDLDSILNNKCAHPNNIHECLNIAALTDLLE